MSQNNRDPQTYTAERALLYALLTDAAFVPEIRDLLSVEDFYAGADGLRGRIYRTILEAWEAGRPHDTLTLTDHFYAAGQARAAEEVGNLDSTAPFTLNPAYYAREIRDRATRRKLLRMGQRFGELARDPNADTVESLGKAEQYLREIQVGSAVGGWSDPASDAAALLDDLDARQRRYQDGAPQGLETGIGPLSALTGPLEGGWLVVVAAAPSVGKTALALQIADHVASQGTPAGFISLEMPRAQLQLRRVAGRAQIPHHILKRGSFNLAERQSLTAAAEEMSALPLLILDDCHTADGICASLRVLKARQPDVGLVVVDYLQLIESKGSDENLRLSAITRSLKLLAIELDVTILLLSQLSRRYADRKDPRPLMSDLRGSGAIEQDADLILFPFRPGVFDDEIPSWVAEIHVAKNRHGDTGRINGHSGIDELRWDGCTQRFLMLDEYTSLTQRRRGR